jgi:hypothetical protein
MPNHQQMKSEFSKALEQNLNSPYSVLTPSGRQAMAQSQQPTQYIKEAGKKKKNEDKERSKARIAAMQQE